MSLANVIQLNSNQVYNDILMFLDFVGENSEKTKQTYKSHIQSFFNKQIEHITKTDILKINKRNFNQWIIEQRDKGSTSNKTINQKVAAVKSLLNYIEDDYELDTSYFDKLITLKEEKTKYGELTIQEIESIALAALDEKNKPEMKYYFFLFALDTAIRKTAILNLKWSDFKVIDEETTLVCGVDKRDKEYTKEIGTWFYEELLSIKGEDERVFPISNSDIDRTFNRCLDRVGIPKVRDGKRIVIHSIRGFAITYAYRITKDLLTAQQVGNHSTVDMTNHYIAKGKIGYMGAYSSKKDINGFDLKSLTKDQLIELIQSDYEIENVLKRKAVERFNK